MLRDNNTKMSECRVGDHVRLQKEGGRKRKRVKKKK